MRIYDEISWWATIFEEFHKMVENLFDAKIKVLWSDCEDEYTLSMFQGYPRVNGIESQTLYAYILNKMV